MVGLSLTLLAIAALGGAMIAVLRLRGTPYPPLGLAIGHGLVAVSGLACLAYAVATTSLGGIAKIALGVLVLAALGGATMFFGFHMRNKPLPIAFVIGHGLIALAGFALLAYYHWWEHEVGLRP
jgi:hypothetical protein